MSMNNKPIDGPMMPSDQLIRRMFGVPMQGDEVAFQLAELRKEVAELRAQLCPPSSVILTGPEVDRILSALKGGA